MTRRNWKRIQPTSLRNALELCKDHAKERHNLSVERVAERMGLTDLWTVYKWIQTGRIPANMIRPYEVACGIDYVTRWLAAGLTGSTGRSASCFVSVASSAGVAAEISKVLESASAIPASVLAK